MKALYTQDIYPLQVTASEMLTATIDIVNQDTGKKMAANAKRSYLLMTMMLLVTILGEIAIFFIARRAKKARLELEERERNLAEVDAKLKSTRQKASDLAVMNVLTGMKNRYALDNDVSERLESDRFNIAVFDMDNFRSINDTYGYDFGDEYLATVAEKLKDEFGNVAEIYNITGNEFCFLFNKEISESQAMGIVQNIQAVMSSPFEVLNLAVQLPCSGAVYHYLPGDCLNVNSLLVKLDTTMRNAKMNGGNMINTVVNI
jgi:diguanylate cyclase (GGDEF)-like protein